MISFSINDKDIVFNEEKGILLVNGVIYSKEQDPRSQQHVCVIVENGWVFEGWKSEDADELENAQYITLANAHIVRKWSNGKGIGAFADKKLKDDYVLDAVLGGGNIAIKADKVLAFFALEW